jgi:hypothetical protein
MRDRDEALVVLTAKRLQRLLDEGGTSSWRLDPNHARGCEYVVCTRNANASWVEGDEPHHSAFVVARVRNVVPAEPDDPEDDRFLVQFGEFARVNVPDVWRKGDRNPVRYATLDELGISVESLQWEPMPPPPAPAVRPLTIQEAKAGLGLRFGVPPESVEITIRG